MIRRAIPLGLLLAASYLAWEFGLDIFRYRQTQQSLVDLESCSTETECKQAWERFQSVAKAKGGDADKD